MAENDNVRVAVRIRPLSEAESERGYQMVVERTPGLEQVVVNRVDMFTFNHVFGTDSTQEEVYKAAVVSMLDCLFNGFNATILAYGQTGSGKTHTMGTAFDGQLNDNVGVIPRAMHDIFRRIVDEQQNNDYVVTCSFLELYQEQLYDLLSDKTRDNSVVDLREDRTGIIMPGLTERVVTSASEATECLVRGSSGRAVASTAMNKQSSRSHAIFTLTIQATDKTERKNVITSKFHLVDLAGSERTKKTQATGDRFKEGVKINQGLLALGNVISALGSGQGQGFVRYRDSKLTRMLQDSLGGNSVTLMIACISPADYNVAETLSTLRYADRARQIKNKPIVNQDPHAAEINHYKSIIQKLRLELITMRGTDGMSSSLNDELQKVSLPNVAAQAINNGANILAAKTKEYEELFSKHCELQLQFQTTLPYLTEIEMKAHIAEAAHEKLRAKTEEIKKLFNHLAQEFVLDENNTLERTDLEKHVKSVQEINKLICGLDEEFERTQCELNEHKLGSSINSGIHNEDEEPCSAGDKTEPNENVRELMREQNDAFTLKQINFNQELQRLNRELNLKEQLQQRVLGNMTKLSALDTLDNMEEKFRECESKIAELEAEKLELMEKLRHHAKENISAKLAEERRRRLQTLEQEIQDMKKRNLQQAKLLKVREKEALKIKNLCSEIQAMKESKVKLIRAMRQESENFRQWKLTREKELMQLRNIDRKRQNEMARKEALHTKQRNVLKRKCEEALAINKRLKDVLDRQKTAQSVRQKLQSTKDASVAANKLDQLLSWVEHEFEVIVTQIDAEHTLEQLMDDRGIISSRIKELRQQQEQDAQQVHPDATQTESAMQAKEELDNLTEELEMRNAQIADLQQKICHTDLDTRLRNLCERIESVADGRAVLKHLLTNLIELRREDMTRILEQRNAIEEQRSLRETAEESQKAAVKRMRLMQMEHEENLAARETTYEEKISVLLRELHSKAEQSTDVTPEQRECMRINSEQLDKLEKMREQLEYYKGLVSDLQAAVANRKRKTTDKQKIEKTTVDDVDLMLSSDNDDIIEQHDSDPDWVKTPLYKRRRTKASRTQNSLQQTRLTSAESSANLDDSFITARTAVNSTATASALPQDMSATNGTAREPSCKCSGKCMTKRCFCIVSGLKCAASKCSCSKNCQNGKFDEDMNQDADSIVSKTSMKSIENIDSDEQKENICTDNTMKSDITPGTPKLSILPTLNFNTPSVKGGFFKSNNF